MLSQVNALQRARARTVRGNLKSTLRHNLTDHLKSALTGNLKRNHPKGPTRR